MILIGGETTNVLISIEQTFTELSVHVVNLEIDRVYTYKIDSIRDNKDIGYIIHSIEEKKLINVINYMKNRYSIIHCGITLSLGPNLRKYITKRRKTKNYENF